MKYIDNKQMLGINYDWGKIWKLYKKLGIPPEYDYSEILPLDDNSIGWYILNSERSVGKTTTALLIGLCMHEIYGTQIQIVRHKVAKASYYKDLFNTVLSFGYVEKITGGKYNTIVEHWRRYYYAYQDESGIIEKSKTPIAVALDASDCYNLCSVYEAPLGDWIILDECFNESNTAEEYVRFCHLFKTIARERLSPKIIVLGNDLDPYNIWYRQLYIHKEILKIKKGEIKKLENNNGRNIFVAYLENKLPVMRKKFNAKFFGNADSSLASITGDGWKMKNYPQTCELEEREFISRGIFFNYYDDEYIELEFIKCTLGLYLTFHPTTWRSAMHGDVCYTMQQPKEKNQIYFGHDKMSKFILDMILKKRVTFSDNETGELFKKFLNEIS